MKLNEEQMAAVQHPLGEPACLIAGAGSGKTRVLTERVRWLIEQGVPPRRILAVTFTNKAASELLHRLDLDPDDPNIPKVSTIHSLALAAIRKDTSGFGLRDRVTPLDDYDQHQMIRKIVERTVDIKEKNISLSSFSYSLLEKVSYHRARGVGFPVDYTDEVHERAIVEHAGYHALDPFDVQIWGLYVEEKQKCNQVDFDDMLHFCNRRGREDAIWLSKFQNAFDCVLMDEAQDTNQCHPPGTLIRKFIGYKKQRGKGKEALHEDVLIETLQDGDKVIPWKRRWGTLAHEGSPVKVARRWYEGNLVKVTCSDKSVLMTPDHRVYAMMNGRGEDSYVVYLMWRQRYGFRVGQCALRFCRDTKHKPMGGFANRCVEEKAERAWILRVEPTKTLSRAWEQVISCKYGIPYAQYEPKLGDNHSLLIETVFNHTNGDGHGCLAEHDLDFNHPLFSRELLGERKAPSKRYFETVAGNLLPGVMSLPSTKGLSQEIITSIEKVPYQGWVYSLEVDKWHTYVANGLVVKNCMWEFTNNLLSPSNANIMAVGDLSQSIMGFQGAQPRLLKEFSEEWRGRKTSLYRISTNHRSLPKIIFLANHIQSKMIDTVPLKMKPFRGDAETKGTLELTRSSLPSDIAMIIAAEISKDNKRKTGHIPYKENAILVRSARQVQDIEGALVRHRIPYVVRGGRGLLQTEEIRDVLSYLRLITNPKDFTALARAVSVPKRGVGDVALEKIRRVAHDKYDGDLIQGATSVEKLGLFAQSLESISKFRDYPVQCLDKIMIYMDYKAYLTSKYKKEPDKVKSKLENIDRFKELVRGLSEDQQMSTEDLVFQLTLERAREDDKDGQVTISTIHSAKGLEYSRVYVTNLVEGSLPHMFSMGSEDEIAEERRLFYVACTRAKDWLTLCVPQMSQSGADTKRATPSRFLIETGIIKE